MITIKDRLIDLAETDAERRLINQWMDEGRDELCARQRAWEAVDVRLARGQVRVRW